MVKLRVLFLFASSKLGGTEVAISRMISAFDREGFWIGVLTLEGLGPVHRQFDGDSVDLCGSLDSLGSIARAGSGFGKLMELTREHKVEIVYAFGVAPTLMSLLSRQLQGWPHYVISGQRGGFHERNLRCLLRALLANRCSAIVFNSETARAQATGFCGFSSTKSFVIPNGFEHPTLPETGASRVAQIITPFVGSGQLTIGTVANIRAPKDYPTLLYAAKNLLAQTDNLSFVSIGRDTLNGKMQALAADLGISSRFYFLGALTSEDTLLMMDQFDVFVLSSRSEGLPNSILEAMVLGKPVVASDVGGVRELVEHGCTGFLFEPGNSGELRDCLWALINDSTLRQQMGKVGASKAQREFSLAESAWKTAQLFATITGREGNNDGFV